MADAAPDFEALPLEDLLIAAATYRERYVSGAAQAILSALEEAEAAAEARIVLRLARLTSADRMRYVRGRDVTTERLRALAEEARRLAREYREITSAGIDEAAREIVPVEAEFQAEYLDAQGVSGATAATLGAIMAAAAARPIQGRHLRDLYRDQEANVARTADTAIRNGIVLGLAADEIGRSLFGTVARQRQDGAIMKHRRGAEGLARTAVAHYNAVAANETFAASGITKYQWLSTLDSRTTFVCMSRDQKVYEQGGPTPPAHFRCRSVVVAVIPGMPLRGQRASSGSSGKKPVPNVAFGPWLRRQSRAFIEDALGSPTKARLFIDGGLKIEKFADIKTGRALTIAELRARNRALFDRLGIAA